MAHPLQSVNIHIKWFLELHEQKFWQIWSCFLWS